MLTHFIASGIHLEMYTLNDTEVICDYSLMIRE